MIADIEKEEWQHCIHYSKRGFIRCCRCFLRGTALVTGITTHYYGECSDPGECDK